MDSILTKVFEFLVVKKVSVDGEGVEGKWVWKERENLIYTVKSTYKILRRELESEHRLFFEIFWKIKTIPFVGSISV